MANEEIVNDVVDDSPETPEVMPQSDGDFKDDVIDYIKDTQHTINNANDTADDSDVTVDSAEPIVDLAGTDIPDAFADAAIASGMTPEEMVEFANSRTNEELLELIPTLESAIKTDDIDEINNVDNKDTKDTPDYQLDADKEAEITERIAKQLEEKFGAALEEIDKFKAFQEQQSRRNNIDTAIKKLDEASEQFSVFGKDEELPRFQTGKLAGEIIPTSPAAKARLEVLQYAGTFMGSGQSIADAMDNALATYAGKHLKKEVQRNVIKDLKNHEVKLSGPRTGKETKKTYSDTREEIIDEIRQMQRVAGIDA